MKPTSTIKNEIDYLKIVPNKNFNRKVRRYKSFVFFFIIYIKVIKIKEMELI